MNGTIKLEFAINNAINQSSANDQVSIQERKLEQDIERDYARLRAFIRKRVANESDVEDILQDIFYTLFEEYRALKPIEQVTAWLYRVARNRIIDLFRKKKPVAFADVPVAALDDGELLVLEDVLASADPNPEEAYLRGALLEALEAALDELPAEQREIFLAHEFEGRGFAELAAEIGASENALRLRKHYAVMHLRKRLAAVHEEFMKHEVKK